MSDPTRDPHATRGSSASGGPIELTLPVAGMTCATCVSRIERYLRRTDGVVEANVNLATERVTIRFDPARSGRDELVRAVEAAGSGSGRST